MTTKPLLTLSCAHEPGDDLLVWCNNEGDLVVSLSRPYQGGQLTFDHVLDSNAERQLARVIAGRSAGLAALAAAIVDDLEAIPPAEAPEGGVHLCRTCGFTTMALDGHQDHEVSRGYQFSRDAYHYGWQS